MSENEAYDPIGVDEDGTDPVPETESAPAGRLLDYDGDGRFDVLLNRFASGAWTTVVDADGDGNPDVFVADLDGDGRADLSVERLADGTYLIQADVDGNGVLDHERVCDRATLLATDPGIVGYLDGYFDPPAAPEPEPVDLVVDGRLIGDPVGDSEHWFRQAQNGYCAPASIAQIVSEYTGTHFADERQFVELANEQQLFTVGDDGVPGMTPEDALKLLEASGVPADLELGTPENLAGYLDEGRRIMLFVDSGEIWRGEAVEDGRADHAVVLTGIDTERGVVILSDPGHPNGDQEEVPLRLFLDAWADSEYTMLVCDSPPPHEQDDVALSSALPDPVPAAAHTSIEDVTSWVVDHPWVLLPVALVASRIVAARS
jgi:hypothetical protein